VAAPSQPILHPSQTAHRMTLPTRPPQPVAQRRRRRHRSEPRRFAQRRVPSHDRDVLQVASPALKHQHQWQHHRARTIPPVATRPRQPLVQQPIQPETRVELVRHDQARVRRQLFIGSFELERKDGFGYRRIHLVGVSLKKTSIHLF
jgi:hypothetical protein